MKKSMTVYVDKDWADNEFGKYNETDYKGNPFNSIIYLPRVYGTKEAIKWQDNKEWFKRKEDIFNDYVKVKITIEELK